MKTGFRDENMLKLFLYLLFLFCLGPYSNCQEPRIISDGQLEKVICDLKNPPTVLWFRIKDTGMEVLGFVDSKGLLRNKLDGINCTKGQMEIEKFNKERDSGVYGCSTSIKENMDFGTATILAGPPDPITTTPATTTSAPPSTTETPCPCKTLKKTSSPGSCEVAILAPLVVSCILLFLTLILTIRHCSRVRTRGCPHHKRRPENPTHANPAKQGRYT